MTVRGFDWFEDTAVEDYLTYELLLEQCAADLLAKYEPTSTSGRPIIIASVSGSASTRTPKSTANAVLR